MGREPDDRVQQAVKEAVDLIKTLETTSVSEVSLETGDFKIKIQRAFSKKGRATAIAAVPLAAGEAAEAQDTNHRVRAPLVGVFYHAPSPGAKAFVEVGGSVSRGQTIGIIETMKVMNEVPADAAGVVVEILVANGQAVEFDAPLIVIDTGS